MFAQERREAIAEELRRQGRVEVSVLASRLGVAEETIRRDLRWMEETGQAVRTHGGALLRPGSIPPLAERQSVSITAKRAIGEAAVGLIGEGESVLLDSGSTGLEIARALRKRQESSAPAAFADVHVVTNSLAIATELAGAVGVVVTVLGGTLRTAELCLVGPDTLAALGRYRLDKVFVACAGFDLERGVAAANPFEAEVKRAMLRGGAQRIVVADSGKLGRTALLAVAGLDSIDLLLTDTGADPQFVAAIQAAGVRVQLA